MLDHAFDAVQTGLALVDGAGAVLRANDAAAAILGRTRAELDGLNLTTLAHPDDAEAALAELAHLLTDRRAGPIVVRLARPDGTWVWVRANAALLPNPDPVGFVVLEDVSSEQQALQALRAAEAESAQRVLQQSAVAALGRAALSGISPTAVAQRATDLVVETLGVRYAAVMYDDGHPDGLLQVAGTGPFEDTVGTFRRARDDAWNELLLRREPRVVRDVAELPEVDRALLISGGFRSLVSSPIVARRVGPGSLVAVADVVDGFSTQDTTFLEAMANILASSLDSHSWMEELRHQAQHDALTGLPNRSLILRELDAALAQSVRHGADVAVLICDLDRFKVVNDGLGHAAGDAVLQHVAHRLRMLVRPGDTVGRFGGDEFVVVCPFVEDRSGVDAIALRLGDAFHAPIEVAGTRLVVSASMGIAIGHDAVPGTSAELLRDADAAMYRAKSEGGGRVALFDGAMREAASRRLTVETELRRALDAGELVVHYQPIVGVVDGDVVGAEALVRWAHPERGLLAPIEFLPVANETGLLPEIGRTVLSIVARDVAAWAADPGWRPHWTAVNLAPCEITDPRLVAGIDRVVAESGVDPRLLGVELTEQSLLEDTVHVAGVLDELRDRGIGISIDDFGTGYSSLAYLKRLPVDTLKLDRAFVDGLGEPGDDETIAAAIVRMAEALHLQVVAEGVETPEQLAVLRAMGCGLAQGYLIARPMPAEALHAWVAAGASGEA